MSRQMIKWGMWVVVLSGILLLVGILSLCIGVSTISIKNIVQLLCNGKDTTEYTILFDIRLPRIILGFAVGGALSIAGVILQGMFRNPLAEPYTLGISGGAALGVCISIVLRLSHIIGIYSLSFFGFLGASIVIVLVYSLSIKRGILKLQGLLLTGIMISFITSSLIMLLMAISHTEDLHGMVFWIMGSLDEPSWHLIKVTVLISLIGLIISYVYSLDLNIFSVGEEDAMHLGVNTERVKRQLFILASILTGCSVSVTGIIGFVGLVVPHFVRMFVGRDHRILLISSFLSGGIFLIFCDTLARTVIAPIELPVGVITGILGGILFVYALAKHQVILGEK